MSRVTFLADIYLYLDLSLRLVIKVLSVRYLVRLLGSKWASVSGLGMCSPDGADTCLSLWDHALVSTSFSPHVPLLLSPCMTSPCSPSQWCLPGEHVTIYGLHLVWMPIWQAWSGFGQLTRHLIGKRVFWMNTWPIIFDPWLIGYNNNLQPGRLCSSQGLSCLRMLPPLCHSLRRRLDSRTV